MTRAESVHKTQVLRPVVKIQSNTFKGYIVFNSFILNSEKKDESSYGKNLQLSFERKVDIYYYYYYYYC